MKLKTILLALLASLVFVGVAEATVYYSGAPYYGYSGGYGTQVKLTYDSSNSYFYAGYTSGYTYPAYNYGYYPSYDYGYYPAYNYGYYPSYDYGYYPSYDYGYGASYCSPSCYYVAGYRHCGCY